MNTQQHFHNLQQFGLTSHFPKQTNSKTNESNKIPINSTGHAEQSTDCLSHLTAVQTGHSIMYSHSANVSCTVRSSRMLSCALADVSKYLVCFFLAQQFPVGQDLLLHEVSTRVGTLIVTTIYLQLIQNRYIFRSFTVLQCSHQHCVQPVASDVEVLGYL